MQERSRGGKRARASIAFAAAAAAATAAPYELRRGGAGGGGGDTDLLEAGGALKELQLEREEVAVGDRQQDGGHLLGERVQVLAVAAARHDHRLHRHRCAELELAGRASVGRSSAQSAGVALPADDHDTYDTRVRSKIHSLANLAAARATCRLAAAARRSQARRWGVKTRTDELKSADLSCL